MKCPACPAVLAIGLFALAGAGELRADYFALDRYQGFSGSDLDFSVFPTRTAGRIHLRLDPDAAGAQNSAKGFAPSGSQLGKLRQLIGWVDAGPMDYDAVQLGARIRPGKRPTEMTIAEILHWIDRTPGQQHAIGRYQFIPSTLRTVVRVAGVDHRARFSPEIQDMLADILLQDAGLQAFLAGEISRHRFMENLARIWAAFPTSSGRSHYHGIAGNRAVISWAEFDTHMRRIFAGQKGQAPG